MKTEEKLIFDISTLEISDIESLIQYYSKQLNDISNDFTSKKHTKNIFACADVLNYLKNVLNTKINNSNIKEQVR